MWKIKCDYGRDEINRPDRYYTPVAFSPTEDVLAFMDDEVDKVGLLDFRTDKRTLLEGHTGFVTGICFSPDGTLVATVERRRNI